MKKRIVAIVAAVCLVIGSIVLAIYLTNTKETKTNKDDGTKISVVTTIFPEYDWVKAIMGEAADTADITMLLDNGVDLHNYQPTADDLIKIANCDLFVYVGGESDEWVEAALSNPVNQNRKVINLLEVLGDRVKAEEVKEGMEADHDHDHGKEVSTFEDNEVQDRSLADWEGEWQSAYPLLLDGSLDKAFEAKAESSDMTAAEYKDYYATGYKTDYTQIAIEGNNIAFTDNQGSTTKSEYRYVGYVIQDWSSGTRAALYRFEAVEKNAGTPLYIELNDHMIESEKAAHFHIRMSNESFDAITNLETSWPTFFPAVLSAEEVCEELIGHDHEEEYDEHVWLSLKNAQILVSEIAKVLSVVDSTNASVYAANAEAYNKQLADLDAQYETVVKNANTKTLLFGDRFPFRYMVDDYGLDYYAAFVGCSAETEASFETISFLANKVDELGLKHIMVIENSDQKIADTIISTSAAKDADILMLDSLQSTTPQDIQNGTTYLSAMQNNLNAMKQALS